MRARGRLAVLLALVPAALGLLGAGVALGVFAFLRGAGLLAKTGVAGTRAIILAR